MTGRPSSDRRQAWQHEHGAPPRPARRRERPRRRWLAVAGYGALALVCLAMGSIAFLLVAPPVDGVRDRLAEQLRARTGRTLTVAGPVSVSLFPRAVVSLHNVAMPPPDGMEGAPTLTVPTVDAEMSLWSFVLRRPRPERVTLYRPTIELAVDAHGRRSWEMALQRHRRAAPSADADGPARAAPQPVPASGPDRPPASARPRRPGLGALRIIDGTVRYRDARSGTQQEVGALALDLAWPDEGDAAALRGAFTWQEQSFRFEGGVSPGAGEQPAQVAFKLAGAPLEAAYNGALALRGGIFADGALTIEHLVLKGLTVGRSRVAVAADGGTAKLTLDDAALYGGRAKGSVTVDATGDAPAVSASLELADVSLLPLLKDTAGAAWLDGRGTVTLELGARGRSREQMVETLQGQVRVAVADGGLAGIDIDRALRALERGRLGGLAPRPHDRTPFSALSGTFDVASGIARNHDLKLVSQHVELNGEGQIELAPRRIDYTLHTKITGGVSGAPADGAVIQIGTLEVPVAIKGPLERPEFTIKGQEGLTDTIKQIGRNLRSREVQDAIQGLIGGNGDKRVKPSELIEKLLKKD